MVTAAFEGTGEDVVAAFWEIVRKQERGQMIFDAIVAALPIMKAVLAGYDPASEQGDE
ncbi:hypothetical protein [Mesorhizobium sp. M0187]|uniref:hypothetical protein n=1 Tax=Mesorhizobium sp. M0187 TaxID=2956908 RepID=UPI003339E513